MTGRSSMFGIPGLVALVALAAAPVSAQGDPFSKVIKSGWDGVKRNVSESAALMPEADYAFKPVPKVRTFGELIGHLANEHYAICSAVKGEKDPNTQDFEKVAGKAALVNALSDSIAYCDPVYAGMTDAMGVAGVKIFDQEMSKAAGLNTNVTHDSEHYGNIVTYLRLKNLVPPSSARQSSM